MKKLYFLVFTLLLTIYTFGQTTVFINEIHYDNNGGDLNEGVEIAGPAGTDLTGWSIVLYNGSNGQSYNTVNLTGSIPDQQNGFGTLSFAISGIQNGAPDGIALVDDSNSVVQFLSYEGSLMATDGPASGMTSTDIGVSETGATLDTESLQLTGSGDTAEEFTWQSPMTATMGSINTGQTFSSTNTQSINITSPLDGDNLASGTTNVNVTFTTNNLQMGDQVNVTVTINGGTPTTTNNATSPFAVNSLADGDTIDVLAEVVNGGVITSDMVSFSVSFPCDLQIGAINSTCDAETSGTDTYTTTIVFTGGGTSNYTIDTGGVGSVGGDDPSSVAGGTITITGVNEDVDFNVTFIGDPSDSSCNIFRAITAPSCVPAASCPNIGDIIITEMLPNPGGSGTDGTNEYFELHNTTPNPIDLIGWVISDDGADSFTVTSSVVIDGGGYALFARNGDNTANGGLPNVDFVYGTDMALANSADEIILSCGGNEIDRVNYTSGFPFSDGVAMELAIESLTSTANDDVANWGAATTPFGDGDLGSPGVPNDFTLSIGELNLANSFKVYPNPTLIGEVTITSSNQTTMDIIVYDILGKPVLTQTIQNNTLNVSNLNTGIYILRITQDDVSSTRKLIIR